ncbi:MAG: hypothetical protein GY867_13120 [bacterium]|nr:hypothetical protein [bacterium]
MEQETRKLSELEKEYLELFAGQVILSDETDEEADLRQPLWGKIVPSITSTHTTT